MRACFYGYAGVGLDRLLPICYSNSAPRLQALPGHVPKTVVVPGSGLQVLTNDDVTTVVEAARFCVGFVAGHLPVQVVVSDARSSLPEVVSLLAVRNVGGEAGGAYLGSFDLVACIHTSRAQPWTRYDGVEMAETSSLLRLVRIRGWLIASRKT